MVSFRSPLWIENILTLRASTDKSNEVKTGGAVPEKGVRITLKVEDEEDLKRDILKSETCALICPELDLDLSMSTIS